MHIFGLQQTIAEAEARNKLQEDFNSLVKELLTDEEKSQQQLQERLRILQEIQGITEDQRQNLIERAIGEATAEAPDFAQDTQFTGAFGELARIDEAQSELESWYATQLELLNSFREDRADLSEQWDAEELELKRQHDQALAAIDSARYQTQLTAAEETFGALADIAKGFAGEQSGVFRALFLIEKASSIARSIVAIQAAIAQAASLGFPANIPAIATVIGQTAGIVSTIQGTQIQGAAQAGIENIPEDGTWFLHRGERVVASETSAKLDATLENIQRNIERPAMRQENIRIVNAFDTNVISDYLGSDEGERLILNVARNNQSVYQRISERAG